MSKKVIVIGGGVAGLLAGIYAALNGFDTVILEMHTFAGGQCTAWDRKGYRFDYCLNWLVGTSKGAFRDVWKETNVINNETVIIDHDIHSRIFDSQGNEFIIYSNIDRWERYLLEKAPEDVKAISGNIQFKKKVEKIIVKNNAAKGVVLADGLQIEADYVIGTADGFTTIYKMLGGNYAYERKYDEKTGHETAQAQKLLHGRAMAFPRRRTAPIGTNR